MPGKYSHGAVLADLSNRGLIKLDDEQHEKYARSLTPTPRIPSRSGARSAQPPSFRSPSGSNEYSLRHGSKRSTVSLSAASGSRTSSKTEPNYNTMAAFDKRLDSPLQYRQGNHQSPRTEHQPLNQYSSRTTHQSVSVEPTSLTRPWRPPGISELDGSVFNDSPRAAVKELSSSAFSLNKPAKQPLRPQGGQTTPSRLSQDQTRIKQALTTTSSLQTSPQPSPQIRKSTSLRETKRLSPLGSTYHSSREEKIKQAKQNHIAKFQKRTRVQTPSQEPSKLEDVKTSPVPVSDQKIEEIPNFKGFSDRPVEEPEYFERPRQKQVHKKQASDGSSAAVTSEPKTPISAHEENKPSRGNLVTTIASNKITEQKPSHQASAVGTTQTKSVETTSSLPGISTWGLSSMMGGKKKVESPRQVSSHSGHEQKWTLPEIVEDSGFSDSIFDTSFDADEIDDSRLAFGSSGFGTISSGRDVTYDDDDTSSEMSAACPPNISRFRDEEAEFHANMARISGQHDFSRADQPSAAPGKKKGFFSRLKNRN